MSAYYRPGRFSFFPPVIKALLVSNAVVFAMTYLFGMMRIGGTPLGEYFMQYGALFPLDSGYFLPWQLFTYMFIHADFSHILFNMLALWMFGLELEHLWGSKKFFTYYTLCGLGGGIAHLIINPLLGGGMAPLVGASGAIFGLLIAFGLLFPDRPIYLYFFIPMRAKYFIALYIALEFFLLSSGTRDGIGRLAHLGGALVGIIYMLIDVGGPAIMANFRSAKSRNRWNEPRTRSPFRRREAIEEEPIEAEYQEVGARAARHESGSGVRIITQSDIDAILDKIAAKGYGSLTNEEREILFEASRKMDERK